ncbi:MAG: hypothetical protein FJ038_00205 [Chloroflexi bacterium]|nr:hypothetical protein [Chloroflexota bacterium]
MTATAEARPRYAAIAALVGRGEWTTYGDISVVAHGTARYARHVGRAAATEEAFPNAERVLAAGGRIAPGWRAEHGAGPGECRRRLEAQGVRFVRDRADPGQRVGWEDLLARSDAADVARTAVLGPW